MYTDINSPFGTSRPKRARWATTAAAVAFGVALAVMLAFAASAQEAKVKKPLGLPETGLTISDCLTILGGLSKLDEQRDVVANKGKPNEMVMKEGYEFGRGGLRLDIAHNIAALTNVQQEVLPAQRKIFYEVLRKVPEVKTPSRPGEVAGPATTIPAGSPQEEEFQRQMLDLSSRPCSAQLTRIRAEDLKIDENRIPISVLSQIDKILDR